MKLTYSFRFEKATQLALAALVLASGLASQVWADTALGPMPMSLKGIAPPPVPGLTDGSSPIVVNKDKAIALGKALFWDVNVGSDGQSCASCHFHAGADRRIKNQIAPTGATAALASAVFEAGADGLGRGPNYRLTARDFPFNQPYAPLEQTSDSSFVRTSDDAVGSSGTFSGKFNSAALTQAAADDCARAPDAVFHAGTVGARQVTQRNAPTVINAVFNHRSFLDGRANNIFNGSSPWGNRDPNAGVWVKNADGTVAKQRLNLVNSSLASQAIAPPANTTEMGCAGRALPDLGRKLQLRRPLENQKVHPQDGVLGPYAVSTADTLKNGLNTYYFTLIRQAFNSKYWASTARGPFGSPKSTSSEDVPQPYSQLEANFGMFFALAIQMYESTLISDDSPFDRSQRDASGLPTELSPAQLRGLQQFRAGHCMACHVGPLFTSAALQTNLQAVKTNPAAFGDAAFSVNISGNVLDRGRGLKGMGFIDVGFASTGVGRDEWDKGLGGIDDFGNPLSFAQQYLQYLAGNTAAVRDPGVSDVRACDLTLPIARSITSPAYIFGPADGVQPQAQSTSACFNALGAFVPTQVAALRELNNPATKKMLTIVDGAFKIPGLRNIELTGPYMHNGSMATLDQVVEFYARGGNFNNGAKQFGFVFPQPDLQLDAGARADLIAFLESLTDDRVRFERAPFDHPELPLLHGHVGNHSTMTAGNALGASLAQDVVETIPATGASGRAAPLKPFNTFLDP